jgi:hypothetical protein
VVEEGEFEMVTEKTGGFSHNELAPCYEEETTTYAIPKQEQKENNNYMNNKIPTQAENPNGLHQKYYIQRIVPEGEDFFGNPKYGLKPVDKDAQYFILRLDNGGSDPKHIAACRKAVLCYANEIKDHLSELSKDLIEKYSISEEVKEDLWEVARQKITINLRILESFLFIKANDPDIEDEDTMPVIKRECKAALNCVKELEERFEQLLTITKK